jgi:hypothetical protein
MPSAIHNLHVLLDSSQHAALRAESRRQKRPATSVARDAIAEYLRRKEREQLEQRLETWARAHAGSQADFDSALEAAASETVIDHVS